jgi:hypothetical protein
MFALDNKIACYYIWKLKDILHICNNNFYPITKMISDNQNIKELDERNQKLLTR